MEIETQTKMNKEMQVHQEKASAYERNNNYMQGNTIDISKLSEENIFFTDASWQPQNSMRKASNTKAGLGVYMQVSQNGCRIRPKISAIVAQATSALQAEAYGLKLAAMILYRLNILDATILTDNITLARAAAARSPRNEPGHWQIRSILADFCALIENIHVKVYHVPTDQNIEAHYSTKMANEHVMVETSSNRFSCTNHVHVLMKCPLLEAVEKVQLQGLVISYVNCFQDDE